MFSTNTQLNRRQHFFHLLWSACNNSSLQLIEYGQRGWLNILNVLFIRVEGESCFEHVVGHLVAVMGHLVAVSISLVKVGQWILCAITNFCFNTWAKWGGGRGVLLNVRVLVRLMPVLRSIDRVIKRIVPINSRWNVEQQEPLSLTQCSLFMTFNIFPFFSSLIPFRCFSVCRGWHLL